jgi:hypothetical protein
MISLVALVNAMATTLANIPELIALLDKGAASVVPYVDENPTSNSSIKAIYKMPAGSLLLFWTGTAPEASGDTMELWTHEVQIHCKASRGQSALVLIDALVDGIPVPGDGLRWRFCPLMDGLLPTSIREISRVTDEEGIDYFVVTTATKETGDDL